MWADRPESRHERRKRSGRHALGFVLSAFSQSWIARLTVAVRAAFSKRFFVRSAHFETGQSVGRMARYRAESRRVPDDGMAIATRRQTVSAGDPLLSDRQRRPHVRPGEILAHEQ